MYQEIRFIFAKRKTINKNRCSPAPLIGWTRPHLLSKGFRLLSNITQLIDSVRIGEAGAPESLLSAVYGELYDMAQSHFIKESNGHTLQTTALVNEAFIRLFGSETNPSWENRAHFFGAAAEAMRRILVDHARRKRSLKRGGGFHRSRSIQDVACTETRLDEVVDVNDALTALAAEHPEKAEVVKLRYFAGLTIAQVADVLQISTPTANRRWAFARAWLFDRIQSD